MAFNFELRYRFEDEIYVAVTGLDPDAPYWYRVIFKIDGDIDGLYSQVENRSSRTHRYENLAPNTRYRLVAEIWNEDDQIKLFDDYMYVYTTEVAGMSYPGFQLSNITHNSVRVAFGVPSGATSCGVFAVPYSDLSNLTKNRAYVDDYTNSPAIVTNLGSYYNNAALQPETTYAIAMDAYNSSTDEESDLSPYKTFTTLAAPNPTLDKPTLDTSYTQKTHNTISVRSNIVPNATHYQIELWNLSKTTRIDYQYSTSRTAYFSGLSAGTEYQIRVKAFATGYTESEWSSWYIATTTIASGWNWQHSTLPGDDIALTRSEWLAFQNKINEIRNGRGYSNYSFTTSTSEIDLGKPIKASHFNEAINAINTMLSSVDDMGTVSAGDPITSAFMIELKNKLNSCII